MAGERHGHGMAGERHAMCESAFSVCTLEQCFSTAGPRPRTGPCINYTGPREVLLKVVIFIFLNIFHE
jgi:hypothetical protein